MRSSSFALIALFLASPAGMAHPPASPAPSLDRLVSANGRGVVVVSGSHASGTVLADFQDHLYQQYRADQAPTRDLLYDGYFGLAEAGSGTWLGAASGLGYRPGTGLVEIDRSDGDLLLTEIVLTPRGLGLPGYVQLLRVQNTGTSPRTLRLFSLHNHHVGSEGDDGIGNHDEAIWVVPGDGGSPLMGEVGTGTGLGMLLRPLATPTSYSCDRVWERMPVEGSLDGRCGSDEEPWVFDDQVGGWQWDPGPLDPGEEAWVGVAAAFFDEGDPDGARAGLEAWLAGRDPATLVADEEALWAAFLGGLRIPADLEPDERAVFVQALVFLSMAQVQEDGDAQGQVPASLPVSAGAEPFSHVWNITWVRDSAYAIAAMNAVGMEAEARDALAFLLQDKAGGFAHLLGGDYGLSVCRLYGDGSEWSDVDANGPNVELDNFGLLLWALQDYVRTSGDMGLVEEHEALVFDGIAQVLVDLTGDDDLLMADSSIWERHWNGHQEQFAYSQAWAVAGLEAAAALALELGEDARAASYRAAATRLRSGICASLVDADGVLAASREQLSRGEPYLDLAGVDAFNNGTLDAAGREGRASLAAWTEGLAVASGQGVKRNDDGDLYDEQEWAWADLRLAQARRRACDEAGARALEDLVTARALANHWTLPELYDPVTGAYAGPAPMMGFGSGLYVLNLAGREEAAADCADGVSLECPELTDGGASDGGAGDGGAGDGGAADGGAADGGAADGGAADGGGSGGGDTGNAEKDDTGCACAAGAGNAPAAWLALAPLALLWGRRRAQGGGGSSSSSTWRKPR